MDRFALNRYHVILHDLHVYPSGNAHETENMSGHIPCTLHGQKITFETTPVLHKYGEITLKLGKIPIKDASFHLQRKLRKKNVDI